MIPSYLDSFLAIYQSWSITATQASTWIKHMDTIIKRAAKRSRFQRKLPMTSPITNAIRLPKGMRQSVPFVTQVSTLPAASRCHGMMAGILPSPYQTVPIMISKLRIAAPTTLAIVESEMAGRGMAIAGRAARSPRRGRRTGGACSYWAASSQSMSSAGSA